MSEVEKGTLYLVPTPIGNLQDITYRAVDILKNADIIAAEDTRHTRILLEHLGIQGHPVSYHEHNKKEAGPKLIEALNVLLADELTAINQYIIHAEMCEDWGYGKLHKGFEKRAIDEMKHAEKLIGRILFLEGKPIVDKLEPIHIGKDVAKMFKNDHTLETDAVKRYNEAIKLCVELKDNGTKELLEAILKDEEEHVDFFEEQLDQIDQMSVPYYLASKA